MSQPESPISGALLDDATDVADGDVASVLELPPARGEHAAAMRVELLLALLERSQAAVLVCADDPAEGGLEGTWTAAGEGRWRLPDTPIDLGELLDWLSLGTWQLVGFPDADAVPDVPVIDLHADPEAGLAAVESLGAVFVVDVFHDEQPWRLALQRS